MSRYTRWFRDGNIKATNGSTEITGSGTYWESAGLNPGDMLEVNNSGLFYEIASINSDTSITLARAYQGATLTGAAYAIVRNFTATMPSKIAAQTSELITDFRKYVDSDMERLTGRSAYEIAKLHGFTGTETEWLASLKGHADEIATINSKIEPLNTSQYQRLSLYRGKNLGSTFSRGLNPFLGDYWRWTSTSGYNLTATVVNISMLTTFNPDADESFYNAGTVWIGGFPGANLYDEEDCSGHFYNSKLFQTTFPAWQRDIENFFGADNVITVYEAIADSCDNSSVTHRTKTPAKLFLPSLWNIGHYLAHSFDGRDAYTQISKIKWPYCNVFHYDWSMYTSANVSTKLWGNTAHKQNQIYYKNPTGKDAVRPYIFVKL